MQPLIADFNQKNPWGIQVEVVNFDSYAALIEQIQASLYGDLPEVVSAYSYYLARLDPSGPFLVDLEPYIKDGKWGLSPDEIDDFIPQFLGQDVTTSQTGTQKRLGLPFYRWSYGLFYNQTWASDLGFTNPPATMQKLSYQLCAAAEAVGQASGSGSNPSGGWAFDASPLALQGLIAAFGGDVSPHRNGYDLDSETVLNAFSYVRDLADEGCAWVPSDSDPESLLADRQALVISGSLADAARQTEAFDKVGSHDRWVFLPFPSDRGEAIPLAYGPSLAAVPSTPRQQLASWLFIRWLVSPENQAAWAEKTGSLPVRTSAYRLLDTYRQSHPEWAAAADLLPESTVEPSAASWITVRWVLSDAGKQIFSPRVSETDLPTVIDMLDQTADELQGQVR
jgi:multiple sugar transport system substrate-binding protein